MKKLIVSLLIGVLALTPLSNARAEGTEVMPKLSNFTFDKCDSKNNYVSFKVEYPKDGGSSLCSVEIHPKDSNSVIYSKTYDEDKKVLEDNLKYKLPANKDFDVVVEAYDQSSYTSVINMGDVKATSNTSKINKDSLKVDKVKPVITVSNTDKKLFLGEGLKLEVSTNEKCSISLNGTTYTNKTKSVFKVYGNATYNISATDEAGNTTNKSVKVDCFKNPLKQSKVQRYQKSSTIKSNLKELPHSGTSKSGVVVYMIIGFLIIGLAGFLFYITCRKLSWLGVNRKEK